MSTLRRTCRLHLGRTSDPLLSISGRQLRISKHLLLTLPSTITMLLAHTIGFQTFHLLLLCLQSRLKKLDSGEQTRVAVGEVVSMKKPYFPYEAVRHGSMGQ